MLGLAGLVALGTMGRGPAPTTPANPLVADRATGVPNLPAETAALPGSPLLRGEGSDPIRLFVPGFDIGTLTGEVVRVKGEVRIESAKARIALVSGRRDTLAVAYVDTSDQGVIRPDGRPSFDVNLTIPNPRPIGSRVFVLITLYDASGASLGAMRRQVDIGPLLVRSAG